MNRDDQLLENKQLEPKAHDQAVSPQASQSNASAANINDGEENAGKVAAIERRQIHPTMHLSSIPQARQEAEQDQEDDINKNNSNSNRNFELNGNEDDQMKKQNSSVLIANEIDNLNQKEIPSRPRADTAMNSFAIGGAPSPYNYHNSKMKTMSNGFSSFGPNNNPFGHYRSMNAIVPSGSFTTKFGANKNVAGDQLSFKRNAARSLRTKIKKAEFVAIEHKKDMLELRNLLEERTDKLKKLGQHIQSNTDGDKNCQRCIFKSFPCFSKCFSSLKYVEHSTVNLRVETITCNKLSHCLFDFDCPDFNAQYENEKYEHHVFKVKNLIANSKEPKMMSLLDQQFERDDMVVTLRDVHFNKTNFLQVQKKENDQMLVDLPYAKAKDNNKHNFIFRIVFKADTGDLWGFNKFECDKQLFQESEYMQLLSNHASKMGEIHEDTKGQVSATLDDIGLNDLSHNDAATHRQGERKDTNYLNESAFDQIHSRLNILDDQITVNYDLSQPTQQKGEEENKDEKEGKKNRRRLSKRQKFAKQNNFKELTQQEIDQEIEFENSVDLDKTMWLVMRDKRSVNNILKRFETKNQLHYLKVNDIVKFGRVNFKVSIIKSDKLQEDIQGGYHLLDKKNQEIQDQLEKLQHQQTQQATMAGAEGQVNLPQNMGKGQLDNELVPRSQSKQQIGLIESNNQQQQNTANVSSPNLNQEDEFHDDERLPTQENVINDADFALGRSSQHMNHVVRSTMRTGFGFNSEMDESRANLQTLNTNIYINDDNNEPMLFSNQYVKGQKRPKNQMNRGLGANPKWFLDDESLRSSVSKLSSAMVSSSRKKSENTEMVCRICLGTEEEGVPDEDGQPDKLICPCKCAGSMGMIHISCLKEWVNGKRLVYKGRKVQSFFWKALECELCNEAFENRMKYRMFQIMKIDLPNDGNEYMIFESIKSAPAKVIHVFDLSKCMPNQRNLEELPKENEFRVGRSVETDMRIADISVSRVHSFIRILGDQLILQDNGSKFGTLVKILKPKKILQLKDQKGQEYPQNYKFNSTIFQVGKTMFYFKFYDQKKKLAQQQCPPLVLRKELNFNPNDERLAYIAWKGTTIHRKTMNHSEIEMIPREFVNNTFTFGKGTINKLSKLKKVQDDFDEESDNFDDDQRLEESPSMTLKNSIEGDNSMMAMKDKFAKTNIDHSTTQDFIAEKAKDQRFDPKQMLNSNLKSEEQEDDEIKDLPRGDQFQFNRGSPFKSGMNQSRTHHTPNSMQFPGQNNEQDEPPVNILRAVNREQGSILSNHKKFQGRVDGEINSNQSFNPNHGRRTGGEVSNHMENVLSSQQDFQSSQSMHARNSISMATSPQDMRQPNFKNVRNIEIKDKIKKINEENNSDQVQDNDDDNNQEPSAFMNNQAQIDRVIREELQYQSQLENKPDIYNLENESKKVIVINDRASEEMLHAVNKQQFLSIRDIEENLNKGDQIDSQIQNYSSQLVQRKTNLSLDPAAAAYQDSNQQLVNATSNLLANNASGQNQGNQQVIQKNLNLQQVAVPSESASFGAPSVKLPVTDKPEGHINLAKQPISKVGLSEYGSQHQSKQQSPMKIAQDMSIENQYGFEQDQAQMRVASQDERAHESNQIQQRQGEVAQTIPHEETSEHQIKS